MSSVSRDASANTQCSAVPGVRRRSASGHWALAALVSVVTSLAHAQGIIGDWSQAKAPPAPALSSVHLNPATTALIVMDISNHTCSSAKRPRCAASQPHIAQLVREARAARVLVLYSLIGKDQRADIPKGFPARPSDKVITGAGPDKFIGTDLEATLKAKGIKTLITVGTSAEGAVLNTASAAALLGFQAVVPVDGMSSSSLYGEQATAWYLAFAPRVSQSVKLTEVSRISF
jgi:nicotinamidase-related amidase